MQRVLTRLAMLNPRFNTEIHWKEVGGWMGPCWLNSQKDYMINLFPRFEGGIQIFINTFSGKIILLR